MNNSHAVLSVLSFLSIVCPLSAQIPAEIREQAGQIEKEIRSTAFPDRHYLITDFGALADNEMNLCHEAINRAITVCSEQGGGKVIIPEGEFHTGPITLKSNVNLHLEAGATLKFATDPELYLPVVLTRWEGLDCYNLRPLIYAYGESNIAITGKGSIDGQGSNEHWWPWKGQASYGWKEGMISQLDQGRPRLLVDSEAGVPVEERIMTLEDRLRPQLINFYHCNTILIEDVSLLNSPFWVIHPLFCESLTVRGVTINSHGPNSDGCDPESSRNVLIENCIFDTGDDCIAIKSGRNADGRKWNIPSENILVRNCYMKDGHGGVVIGSEISGGYRNLFVENCRMDSPNLDRVIRIKTNTCRGGIIENIYVRNITVGECREAVLKINLLYEQNELCDHSFPPLVRNVWLDNITSQKSKYGVLIRGLKNDVNIKNIHVSNSSFSNVQDGNLITGGVEDIHLKSLIINGQAID